MPRYVSTGICVFIVKLFSDIIFVNLIWAKFVPFGLKLMLIYRFLVDWIPYHTKTTRYIWEKTVYSILTLIFRSIDRLYNNDHLFKNALPSAHFGTACRVSIAQIMIIIRDEKNVEREFFEPKMVMPYGVRYAHSGYPPSLIQLMRGAKCQIKNQSSLNFFLLQNLFITFLSTSYTS